MNENIKELVAEDRKKVRHDRFLRFGYRLAGIFVATPLVLGVSYWMGYQPNPFIIGGIAGVLPVMGMDLLAPKGILNSKMNQMRYSQKLAVKINAELKDMHKRVQDFEEPHAVIDLCLAYIHIKGKNFPAPVANYPLPDHIDCSAPMRTMNAKEISPIDYSLLNVDTYPYFDFLLSQPNFKVRPSDVTDTPLMKQLIERHPDKFGRKSQVYASPQIAEKILYIEQNMQYFNQAEMPAIYQQNDEIVKFQKLLSAMQTVQVKASQQELAESIYNYEVTLDKHIGSIEAGMAKAVRIHNKYYRAQR